MHALALVAAALAGLVLAGCEKSGGEAAGKPPAGRFDAVQAKQKRPVTLDELCDVLPAAGAGASFRFPELVGPAPPASGWRWINLWATWCKPCVEEIPMLRDWHKQLAAAGVAFDLAFVSIDADDEVVAAFRRAHPGSPAGPRLAKPDELPAFLEAVGIDRNAPIPVHVFVGPDDKVRCVRAGGLKTADLDAVRQIFR